MICLPSNYALTKEDVNNICLYGMAYEKAFQAYKTNDVCMKEFNQKYSLRADYLNCNAADKDICVVAEKVGEETSRRVSQVWAYKVQVGMMKKSEKPELSLDQFEERAKVYQVLVNDAQKEGNLWNNHADTFVKYRDLIVSLLKKNAKVEDITTALNTADVNETRVYTKVAYWREKEVILRK